MIWLFGRSALPSPYPLRLGIAMKLYSWLIDYGVVSRPSFRNWDSESHGVDDENPQWKTSKRDGRTDRCQNNKPSIFLAQNFRSFFMFREIISPPNPRPTLCQLTTVTEIFLRAPVHHFVSPWQPVLKTVIHEKVIEWLLFSWNLYNLYRPSAYETVSPHSQSRRWKSRPNNFVSKDTEDWRLSLLMQIAIFARTLLVRPFSRAGVIK